MTDAGDVLARTLGKALGARGITCATAESCTGGLVAGAITAIAGSSEWFDRGFVTYSNDAKHRLLGVPLDTLDAHGAVSEPVARAMAEGALRGSLADAAVAITGIAGPGGGSPGKPVGTVCFGWARVGYDTRVATLRLPGDRAAVREESVLVALAGLVAMLKEDDM